MAYIGISKLDRSKYGNQSKLATTVWAVEIEHPGSDEWHVVALFADRKSAVAWAKSDAEEFHPIDIAVRETPVLA